MGRRTKRKSAPGKAAPCIDETAGLDLNQLAALSGLCSQVTADATTMARQHNSLNYGHSAPVPKCSETRIV